MQNETHEAFLEDQSWLECIGDLISKSYMTPTSQQVVLDDQIFLDATSSSQNYARQTLKKSNQTQLQEGNKHQMQTTGKRGYQQMQGLYEKKEQKTVQIGSDPIDEEQSSKQESKESDRQNKHIKQSQYSRNYRQRKKELLKTLQEQNTYLKKKINELQIRLRQKQRQINQLKHIPAQKQVTLEQLNEDFLKKTNLHLTKATIDPTVYQKTTTSPEEKLYQQFMNSYDEHGFGGSRKINTFNYYFNELLLSVLRDSEKYMFLVFNQCNDVEDARGLHTYQHIDLVFQEIMQLDPDKTLRLNHFTRNLHPFMRQLKTICADLYANFNRVLAFVDKVHKFMKASYPQNMDFARKRIELENWFEHNKHSKILRRLRSEWLQYIKRSVHQDTEEKNVKLKKKKKNLETAKQDSSS